MGCSGRRGGNARDPASRMSSSSRRPTGRYRVCVRGGIMVVKEKEATDPLPPPGLTGAPSLRNLLKAHFVVPPRAPNTGPEGSETMKTTDVAVVGGGLGGLPVATRL